MMFVTMIDDKWDHWLSIGDECQSICNGNTMKASVMRRAVGGGIEYGDDELDSDDYNDDDNYVVIWL